VRKWYVLLAAIMAVVVVGSVSAATSDQGRRLAGPFCIGKRFLQPVQRGQQTISPQARLSILRAGVVRSVSKNEKCRPWENRKDGVAVNGPAGPGKDGKDGDLGDHTRWICVHGKPLDEVKTLTNDDSNGGPLFDGGTGVTPDCKGGAKFAFKVVTQGDIVTFN
jgi:hypothetical protein